MEVKKILSTANGSQQELLFFGHVLAKFPQVKGP